MMILQTLTTPEIYGLYGMLGIVIIFTSYLIFKVFVIIYEDVWETIAKLRNKR